MLFSVSAIILISSCASNANKTESSHGISGRFVNNSVFKNSVDSMSPYYCLEMNFVSGDSVNIYNGIDATYKIAYKKEDDHYCLLNASFKGNMLFTLNQDSTITLIDSSWTGVASNSEFKKVLEINGQEIVFDYYLNEAMVAGEYLLYKVDKLTQQKVVFMADGSVTGLEDFVKYEICYAGDCVEETEPSSNTICFSDSNNKETVYAFKIDKKKKALRISNIGSPIKDIKGERAILDLAFDLRKQ